MLDQILLLGTLWLFQYTKFLAIFLSVFRKRRDFSYQWSQLKSLRQKVHSLLEMMLDQTLLLLKKCNMEPT